jgi:hypothetical protein
MEDIKLYKRYEIDYSLPITSTAENLKRLGQELLVVSLYEAGKILTEPTPDTSYIATSHLKMNAMNNVISANKFIAENNKEKQEITEYVLE